MCRTAESQSYQKTALVLLKRRFLRHPPASKSGAVAQREFLFLLLRYPYNHDRLHSSTGGY